LISSLFKKYLMSSEIHKNIETFSDKQKVLFDAEVINFSKEKNHSKNKFKKFDNLNIWTLNDKSNEDQLKTVVIKNCGWNLLYAWDFNCDGLIF